MYVFLDFQVWDKRTATTNVNKYTTCVIFMSYKNELRIDLIHDTRHLCTCLRIDGINAMSRGFSGGKQVKNCQWKKSRLSLFILDNRK